MTLRALPEDMNPHAVARIDAMLTDIGHEHGVRIPWAIESGSRAWGFPSPDSDYDARFLYVRPADQWLTVWPRRDVIECPIVDDLDVNGWDLAKALRLILKGNAVVIEWLNSPIIYRGEAWFRERLVAFAERWIDRDRLAAHYLYLSRRHRESDLGDKDEIKLKKLFYALRPAAALGWLERHPDQKLPPMSFLELMRDCGASADVRDLAEDLVRRKAVTRELGRGPAPAPLIDFIDQTLTRGDAQAVRGRPASREAMRAADTVLAEVTRKLDASPTSSRERPRRER